MKLTTRIKNQISLWLFGVDAQTIGKHIRILEGKSLVTSGEGDLRIKAIEDKLKEMDNNPNEYVDRSDVWDMACETVSEEVPTMFEHLMEQDDFKKKIVTIVQASKRKPKKK
jgi:hypothetical protein